MALVLEVGDNNKVVEDSPAELEELAAQVVDSIEVVDTELLVERRVAEDASVAAGAMAVEVEPFHYPLHLDWAYILAAASVVDTEAEHSFAGNPQVGHIVVEAVVDSSSRINVSFVSALRSVKLYCCTRCR